MNKLLILALIGAASASWAAGSDSKPADQHKVEEHKELHEKSEKHEELHKHHDENKEQK